jgi:penicillin amidase
METVHTRKEFDVEYIPFEELPYVINPEKGYMMTTNNPIIDKFDYVIQGYHSSGARSRALDKAIQAMINSGVKITHEAINEKLLKNIEDVDSLDIINSIRETLRKDKSVVIKTNLTKLLNVLYAFDGQMKSDSLGALLLNVL